MSRVTVVNDSSDVLSLLAEALSDRDVTPVIGDGSEAMDQVERSAPDLVMVDLWSGNVVLQGWHFAQQLRQRPSLKRTPLVLISSHAAAIDKLASEMGTATGVSTLLAPFSLEQLDAAIRGALGSKQRQSPPSTSRRASASS